MFTQEWLLEVFKAHCINFTWCAFVILLVGFAERRWPAGERANVSDCTFNFVLAFIVSILLAISLKPLGVVHTFLATTSRRQKAILSRFSSPCLGSDEISGFNSGHACPEITTVCCGRKKQI